MKRSIQFGVTVVAFGVSVAFGAARQDSKAGAAAGGDAAKGKEVFEQCSVCHNADTDEKKIGPSLKGLFKHEKLVTGKKPTEENVLEIINTGGNGMPSYADMLSKEDKANVIAYLKTL
jgi:cytochrome c2